MKTIIHLKGDLSLTNGVIIQEEKFTSSTVSKMSFLNLSGKQASNLLNNTVEPNNLAAWSLKSYQNSSQYSLIEYTLVLSANGARVTLPSASQSKLLPSRQQLT
jgi:hypothetical protein